MHSKRNHKQNKKTTYETGENICKGCKGQGIDFQNIQTAHTGQYQKSKQLNQNLRLLISIFHTYVIHLHITSNWENLNYDNGVFINTYASKC